MKDRIVENFERFNENRDEYEFRYVPFIYRDESTTKFDDFTVRARTQEIADVMASKEVIKMYPRFADTINFSRYGEKENMMSKFRSKK